MRLRQYFEEQAESASVQRHQTRSQAKARAKTPQKTLFAHPVFVPMLAVWGAALFALCVVVLPDSSLAHASILLGVSAWGDMARFVMAGGAAILGASLAATLAMGLRSFNQPRREVLTLLAHSVQKTDDLDFFSKRNGVIDPATELGSDSLDAPLNARPQAAARKEKASPATETLDLTDFAQAQPDTVTDEQPETVVDEDASAQEGASAPKLATDSLAKLRATPTDQLSMVQMVERFAGALNEYQANEDGRADVQPDQFEIEQHHRDEALAEALRALMLMTERDLARMPRQADIAPLRPANSAANRGAPRTPSVNPIAGSESELRDALSRLQTLRGAA